MIRRENDVALKDYLDKWGMRVCPIDRSLKIMGQRYALHIMKNMILLKQNRFNQFLHTIDGINTKTLSIRLHELEEYGLVKRKVIPGRPAHTEYSPTEKGMAVRGILAEIASFSIKYEPEIVFIDKKPRNIMKALFGTGDLSSL
ncbi:MAG TPA: helix-turn-helix domain-containing protein [Nitrososphaeraceae archaeon]